MKAAKRLDKFHTLLRDEQVYCEKYGDAAPTKVTHSAVKCALCGGTLAGLHYVGGVSSNPVPSYAMILRRKLAKGHSQEEAEELARRELQQANIFLSEGRKKNPVCKNGPVKIYGQTEKIFMKKTAGPYKGQKFVHDFKGGVRQIGLPRGTKVQFPDGRSARLTTRSVLLDGKKDLWRNFAA